MRNLQFFKTVIGPHYLLQFGTQFTNFLVVPMALIFLPLEDRTIWLLFFTISTLNPILLLGFESSIFRASSYILAGAVELLPNGMGKTHPKPYVDADLMSRFVSSTKYIFRLFSSSILILMYIVGFFYFNSLSESYSAVENLSLSWLIFSVGVFVNNSGIYRDSILRGSGAQNALNLIYIFSRIGFFSLSSIILQFFASGLLVVSISFSVSIIFQRLCILRIWNRSTLLETSKSKFDFEVIHRIFLILWPNSYRTALVFVGSFLTLRGGILLAPKLTSANIAADYVLEVTLVLGLSAVATELGRVKLPSLHKAQISESISKVRDITREIFVVALCSYLLGAMVLVFLAFSNAKIAIDFGMNLNLRILIPLLLINLFELTYSLSGVFLSSENTNPIVKSSLVTGVSNIVLSTVLGTSFGIFGLIFSQFSLGLIFNYWYWPVRVAKRLKS